MVLHDLRRTARLSSVRVGASQTGILQARSRACHTGVEGGVYDRYGYLPEKRYARPADGDPGAHPEKGARGLISACGDLVGVLSEAPSRDHRQGL